MRKLLLLAMTVLLSLPTISKTYCLLTAVSNYGNEAMNLKRSTDDAKRMASFYNKIKRTYKESGIAKIERRTGVRASSDSILARIKVLQKICKPDDQVVFYFAGLGERNFLITYDYHKNLYYNELIQELRKINCKHVVIFLDACYSGTIMSTKGADGNEYMNSDLEKNIGDNEKFILMTACRNTETAKESSSTKGGYFTTALLNGLGGAADADGNKEITVKELHTYVWNYVLHLQYNRNQHPTLITNYKNHDVVLMTLR